MSLSLSCRHAYPGGFILDATFQTSHRVTAVFGPSGSGKTTLLGLVAGFLRPQKGRILLDDRLLVDTSLGLVLPPEKREIGYVFQDHLLFPHLTAEGNLRYGQRHRRGGRPIAMERVVEVLEIGPLLRRYPKHLSGGERQRVALGRALLSGPRLLLMDEPLASLDAPLKARILAYLERIVAQWEIPTLFVTHSQAEVRRLAQWVIVLDRGRIVASGTPEEALSRPEPLGWKNATGPMNLLRLDDVQFASEETLGHVGGQAIHIPPLPAPAAMPVFVEFSPADVTLSRQDIPGLSARNHLRGRVCRLVALDRAVFVAVDIGQILWAEVTPQAVAELQLASGVEVTCLLKAHSLRVLE
jgi:molybdate transport system ATP-binding protein